MQRSKKLDRTRNDNKKQAQNRITPSFLCWCPLSLVVVNKQANTMDWFGVRSSPHDLSNKCVFCQDKRVNPFDDPGEKNNRYKTTTCRHLVCGNCEDDIVGGRPVCPLCGSNIGQLKPAHPHFLALDSLNLIRKQVYEVYNLDLERDFHGNEHAYNDFVEERENLVFEQQRAEQSFGEEKKQLLGALDKKRTQFVKKHKEQIDSNSARIEDHRRQVASEIRTMREELKRNKEQMRREKEREEEERLLLVANKNAARLGFHVTKPTTGVVKEEKDTRLIVPNIDILASIPRAPPTLVKRVKRDSEGKVITPPPLVNGTLLACYRAAGRKDVDARNRTLEEMRAGWTDLLLTY